jgi:peptidoglycan-associated lipoprotein
MNTRFGVNSFHGDESEIMHMLKTSSIGVILTAALAAVGVGCGGKKLPTYTPPTGAVAPPSTTSDTTTMKPTLLQFTVEPTVVERGQSATLRWSVNNATSIAIDNGIGDVQSSGNRRITPSETTTYRLNASGPNGTISGTTTVTVTNPAPPTTPARTTTMTLEQSVNRLLVDAYFDYDSNQIRPDARDALTKDADSLKKIFADFPSASVIVEGHCDERGSAEYNLGLADQRASATKEYLTSLGVPAAKLKTVSYGKERPQCTEQTEECFQKNRRAHFTAAQ